MEVKQQEWEQVKSLFEAALEQEPEIRSRFLNAHCSDPKIRKEVLDLIANHEEMGSFLTQKAATVERARSTAFIPGQLIADRFTVTRFVASGGMGEVYEAMDLELQTPVAIKAIRPDLLNTDSQQRFKHEVQLAKQVTHPNVCRVYDLFRHSDGINPPIFFISMEYLRGETLAEMLRNVPRLSTEEALPLVLQIASALASAHDLGILHRDLKPENIMLVPGEQGVRAVVMDFGVALRAEGPLTDSPSTMRTGTPAYMSPEQLESGNLTPASDIYSLGLVIYRMVTGRHAFRDTTTTSEVLHRLSEVPTSPCELVSDLDRSWETVIVRCLEPEPSRRYPNARYVGQALDRQYPALPLGHRGGSYGRAMTDEPISDSAVSGGIIKRHKWAVVGTSAAVIVLAAAAGLFLLQILRRPAKVPVELTQERLTFNSSDHPVSSFALSADAEYLAYADLAGIHVKLLSTGEERLIPKPKRASANASWEIASWFPDRSRLLVHLGAPVLDEAGGPGSTWAVSVLGRSPRQLRESAWGWEVSPDGARIAFSPLRASNGDAREIWVMDNQGSNPRRVLAAEGNEWLNTVRWSPDGLRLAYLRSRRSSNPNTNSIETCDLNGANCAVVVPHEVGHCIVIFRGCRTGGSSTRAKSRLRTLLAIFGSVGSTPV
ncbi:MAG: serine/threonine-protein kinase [Acidobacteriaceae bacterium]|nr:serine/threonine-protein kinase [Acidobacteriaceae bacterium]MBV9781247.1 serine/threonine-protein kinase [Acidobacteriaceae bacterium]